MPSRDHARRPARGVRRCTGGIRRLGALADQSKWRESLCELAELMGGGTGRPRQDGKSCRGKSGDSKGGGPDRARRAGDGVERLLCRSFRNPGWRPRADPLPQLVMAWFANSMLNLPVSEGQEPFPSFEMRCSVRSELQRCGIDRIMPKLEALRHHLIDNEVERYRSHDERDGEILTREYDRKMLKDLRNPQDVFNGLMRSVQGTKAQDFFLSVMRHLMLIKDDGDRRIRYFQLINSLVRAVVLDGQAGVDRDFSSVIDVTVRRVLGKLEETELLEQARAKIAELEGRIVHLQRDKESMAHELADRDGGLVGHLKQQVAQSEEKLRVSRHNTNTLQVELTTLREESNQDQEQMLIWLRVLFKLLADQIGPDAALELLNALGPNMQALVALLDTEFERVKTIRILEGRHGKKAHGNGVNESHFSDDETAEGFDDADEEAEVHLADKIAFGNDQGRQKSFAASRKEIVSGSAFVDAEDERVNAHIEARLIEEETVGLKCVAVPFDADCDCETVSATTQGLLAPQCAQPRLLV